MVDSGLTSELLYRFGFLAYHSGYEVHQAGLDIIKRTWRRREMGTMTFWFHPEATWASMDTRHGVIVLIGSAFAFPEGRRVDSLLKEIAATPAPSVWDVLDQLSGRFALFLLGQGRQWVMHDPFGSRSLFYADGSAAVSSHAELLALTTHREEDPVIARFRSLPEYRARGVTYLPGDWTVYRGVYGLAPNNYYDLANHTTVRFWPRHPLARSEVEGFFDTAEAYFRAFAGFLRGRFEPILGLTGGIDTRAVIAALRANDLPCELVTWLGNYMPDREVPIVQTLVGYLAERHSYIDASEIRDEQVYREVKAVASRNVGNYRGHAKLTAHMYRHFHDREKAVFVRGYGGEIVRGFYNVSRAPMMGCSVSELFRAFNLGLRARPPSDEYSGIGLKAFEEYVIRANYSPSFADLGYDVNDIFYWEQRMGMWGSAMHNEMDAAIESMTAYNSRTLYEAAFGLPKERRLSKRLLRDLTGRYEPKLANIEVTR